jgi:hypothetical protein
MQTIRTGRRHTKLHATATIFVGSDCLVVGREADGNGPAQDLPRGRSTAV